VRRGIGAALLALLLAGAAIAADRTGPSSSQSTYLVASQNGVQTRSILTVGDSVAGYRLVGLPDGLGAFDNGDGTFTVLMNHELPSNRGVVRAHGAVGAFVSKWVVRKGDLSVVSGQDLIQNVATWNTATSSYNAPGKGVALNRLCSADLPEPSAFYDSASGLGYGGRLFMDGEETAGGRGFAHALDGTSWELPRLGKFAWENSVESPNGGTKTIVVGTDDATPGEIYVYVGSKTSSGSPVDKAGLTNGSLYGIEVAGYPAESIATGIRPAPRFRCTSSATSRTGAVHSCRRRARPGA
jgi:hypothetical protein